MSAQDYFKHLVQRNIINERQFARIENWKNGEVLVLKRMTDPQNYAVMNALQCDLIHSESTHDTTNCNNYYYGNFRKQLA